MPFAVRTYTLPDLFAGKMHALLCRCWKNCFKGRDWYDLVWYCANYPELHLAHLESRMRQSGHWRNSEPLTATTLGVLLTTAIEGLDVAAARSEVAPFVRDHAVLDLWSQGFFHDIVSRIKVV